MLSTPYTHSHLKTTNTNNQTKVRRKTLSKPTLKLKLFLCTDLIRIIYDKIRFCNRYKEACRI